MSQADSTLNPRERALKRCQENINWYEKAKHRQRLAYQSFQVSAIVLSGLTPVLILWGDLPKALQALPAALAAIAARMAGVFQWKESYPRFAYVCEALKSERLKFETRTTAEYGPDLDKHQALDNFVVGREALVMDEVTDWRTQVQKAASSPSRSGQEG